MKIVDTGFCVRFFSSRFNFMLLDTIFVFLSIITMFLSKNNRVYK